MICLKYYKWIIQIIQFTAFAKSDFSFRLPDSAMSPHSE